jgi:cytochrome c peroxidase
LLGLGACHRQTTDTLATTPVDEQNLTSIQLLGKRIFEDTNLSEPKGQSCASCHDAKLAFSGNNGSTIAAVALGSREHMFGNRNTPSIMYAAYTPPFAFREELDEAGQPQSIPSGGLFWDGRADTLQAQAKGPLLNPREMNGGDATTVIGKIRASSYAQLFREVFGNDPLMNSGQAFDKAAQAIAAFEQTQRFAPFSSKFDAVLQGKEVFTAQEQRGFELFKDNTKGNCLACHTGKEDSHQPSDWLFTDFTYDNVGLPRNDTIPDNSDKNFYDLGLCQQDGIVKKAPKDFNLETLCGAFKVPTLRNIDLTAPYGHNGFFANLRDVVKFYATRNTDASHWYPSGSYNDIPSQYTPNVNVDEIPYDRKAGEEARLNDAEIDAIVVFLKTLTDR